MFSRYRLCQLAVRGFLIGLILCSSVALSHAGEPKGKAPESKPAAEQRAPIKPTAPAIPLKTPDTAEQAKGLCDKPQNSKERDLCQQWRMAEAAQKQAKWTKRQFWITVAEVLGLLGVVVLTVLTAKAANRSAKAAESAVEVTRISAEHQLRAYIFIKDALRTRREVMDPWVIEIHIKNFGQTPAYRAEFRVSAEIIDPADEAEFAFPLPEIEDLKFDLAPDHEHTTRIDIPWLTGEVWREFKAHRKNIFLWGRVDFVDAFGKPRWMNFRFTQPGGYVLNLYTCKEGNETSESNEIEAPI